MHISNLLNFSLLLTFLSYSYSLLQCEFHVSSKLPTVFEVKQGLVDAGNISDDGTSMVCHPPFGQCATLWGFDPDTNDTTILLQGCWKGNADCERPDCLAVDTINHRYLNNSRFCCCSSMNCNANFSYVWTPKRATNFLPKFLTVQDESFTIKIIFSMLAVLAIAVSTFFIVYFIKKRTQNLSSSKSNGDNIEHDGLLDSSMEKKHSTFKYNLFMDADRLIISDIISCGRYSVVRRAYVVDDSKRREFAVKIYQQSNRHYFANERNVFSTPLLSHDNLIEYFGYVERRRVGETNDDDDENLIDRPQYWLITKFMVGGTLQDYLKVNTFDYESMCKMALSVAKGLAYLHGDVRKDGFHKPAIAHRDLNSRNVLMKSDGTCVVSDLGFALVLESAQLRGGDVCEEASLTEVGTVRYMSPEVLEGAVNLRDPETALKQVDVYSLGLVFWEIISRCVDITGPNCPDYNPPYAKEASTTHPSLEQMQLLVCKKKVRPLFPNLMYKHNNPPLRDLRDLVEDCWDQDSEARITASCAQERVTELYHSVIVDSNGPVYICSPGQHHSNVVDLNAINVAHNNRLIMPHPYLSYYADCQRSSPFSESTADTTVTGTTSGLGSMCLNSSDRARSLNSGSSFGYRGNGSELVDDAVPLQPYQGLNPCLERNLHLESSDSSSGYSNRVVESNFDKIDPCAVENFAKLVPNALLALANKTSSSGVGCDKNERRSYVRPTSNNLDSNHFNNDVSLALLLLKSRDDRPSNRITSIQNDIVGDSTMTPTVTTIEEDVSGRSVDSDNCETPPLTSSNVSPGGGSSTSSSADSAYDRRSLSVSDASASVKQTPSTTTTDDDKIISKKRSSRTSLDVETTSAPLKFKRFSIDVGKFV